jgi:hypothetical protein
MNRKPENSETKRVERADAKSATATDRSHATWPTVTRQPVWQRDYSRDPQGPELITQERTGVDRRGRSTYRMLTPEIRQRERERRLGKAPWKGIQEGDVELPPMEPPESKRPSVISPLTRMTPMTAAEKRRMKTGK